MSEEGLVAKRLRYIERQKELHKERVNVTFADRAPASNVIASTPSLPPTQSRSTWSAGLPYENDTTCTVTY